ncbi:hypothetical protein [Vibrio phage YC]|uniref:Uncharacterized protein n=1 Tax=Vibrio phage YC TaxID=2267403 RepID=A0A384ZS77_9CAUD|nr:hypothetical protein HWB64_gp119 [Vibrio phage YC]AXC34488.1 hypothetical protein [Vibrio phage YC]
MYSEIIGTVIVCGGMILAARDHSVNLTTSKPYRKPKRGNAVLEFFASVPRIGIPKVSVAPSTRVFQSTVRECVIERKRETDNITCEPLGLGSIGKDMSEWHMWVGHWNLGGGYSLDYSRQIRGTLVEIHKDGEEIWSYVDQTAQYPHLLDIGDEVYKPNAREAFIQYLKEENIL